MSTNISAKILIRSLLYLLAFSFTFFNIGFLYAGIRVNIPVITILILDFILIFKGKIILSDFFFVTLFGTICLLSAFYRFPVLSYFPSFVYTMALIFPLCILWTDVEIDKEKLLNYLVLGAIISAFYIPFELYFRYMHLFGYTGNELWISIGGASHRFYRASSLMLEPSHYVLVLFFIYLFVDFAKDKGYLVKHLILFKYCFFIALILGASLSGIALLILYYFFKILKFVFRCFLGSIKIRIKRKSVIIIITAIILVIFVNILSNNFISKVASKIHERVLLTKDVIEKQKSEGSSGERSSFIWVSKIYVKQSSAINILIGEGFSNYRQWLLNNEKQIGYKTGEVYNLLLVVLLSSGLLGLIIFILMVIKISNINLLIYDETVFIILVFVSFFTHGYLTMYWVWIPILFFKIIKTNTR